MNLKVAQRWYINLTLLKFYETTSIEKVGEMMLIHVILK